MKFAHPEMFYWLLLLCIPIIIHLFNFRKYKRYYFTNLSFLKSVTSETQKQSKLKHLIILFIRMLIIGFIVIAFAVPYISVGNYNNNFTDNSVSIFIDNSFSMENEDSEGRAIDIASEYAKNIISVYKISDKFQILTNDFYGFQQRFYNKDEAGEIINDITLTSASKFTDEIINRQSSALKDEYARNKIIYMISDFQSGMFRNRPLTVDTSLVINFIRVNSENKNNIYIDSCWFNSPVHNILGKAELNVKIVNNSDEVVEQLPLKLFINGVNKTITDFRVEAKSSIIVPITYIDREAGFKSCYVEIPDYPVTYDNILYFSYVVNEKFTISSVTGENDNEFLKALYSTDSTFNYINFDISRNIDYNSLKRSDVIVIAGIDILSTGIISELKQFVDSGGSIVIYPPPSNAVESYNQLFNLLKIGTYGNYIEGKNKINDILFTDQLYNDVFYNSGHNIDLPIIERWYKLNTKVENPGTSILTMLNNDIFLSRFMIGNSGGKVYVFTSPLDRQTSGFPRHSLFVPTMYAIAFNSVIQNGIYRYIDDEKFYPIDIDDNVNYELKVELVSINSGTRFILPVVEKEGNMGIVFDNINLQAGNYKIEVKDKTVGIISLNNERIESSDGFYSDKEIREWAKINNIRNLNLINTDNIIQSSVIYELTSGIKLWKYFLLAALMCLLIEVVLLRFWKK